MHDERDETSGASAAPDACRVRSALVRARSLLGESCAPCTERDGALRREMLCRCPVALSLRLLARAERGGVEPGALAAGERSSLDFQERALADRPMPADPGAVVQAVACLATSAHGTDCPVDGCLACRARRVLEVAAERVGVGSTLR